MGRGRKKKVDAIQQLKSYLENIKGEDVSAVFDKPGEWKDLHGDRKRSQKGQVLIETRKTKKGYEGRVRVGGYGLLVESVPLGDEDEEEPSGAEVVAFFQNYNF